MKIAIYSRKSRFTGHGESVENQISMCKNYISGQFGTLPEEDILVFEDEGFSGKNTNRPQFQRMMHLARQHSFDKLVCYRLDRFSRDIRDFTAILSELEHLHIDFICIREQFDTTSPMGRAMMYIASVFAQLERETIAQRIRDNMLELAKTGRWLGGRRRWDIPVNRCIAALRPSISYSPFRKKLIQYVSFSGFMYNPVPSRNWNKNCCCAALIRGREMPFPVTVCVFCSAIRYMLRQTLKHMLFCSNLAVRCLGWKRTMMVRMDSWATIKQVKQVLFFCITTTIANGF